MEPLNVQVSLISPLIKFDWRFKPVPLYGGYGGSCYVSCFDMNALRFDLMGMDGADTKRT